MAQNKPNTQEIKPPSKGKRERKPPKKITETYLHNAGLYYLQRFAASSGHFRAVMMRKVKRSCHHHKDQNLQDCAAMVDALVEKFVASGLLDDKAYLQGTINSLRRRGLSRAAILSRLQTRGLDAAEALRAYDEDHYEDSSEAELGAALTYARRKKIGPYAVKEVEPEKMLAALARQGFSYDICRKILDMDTETVEKITGRIR